MNPELRTMAEREREITLERIAELEGELAQANRDLAGLNAMLGLVPQPSETALRGRALRRRIIAALEQNGSIEPEGFHYRELFDLLTEQGEEIGGRDPIATLLTNLTRCAQIERVGGNRSGRYRLAARLPEVPTT